MIPLTTVGGLAGKARDVIPHVDLSPATEESYYAIAGALMKATRWIIHACGLSDSQTLFTVIYALLVFVLSFGVGMIIQAIVVFVVRQVAKRWSRGIFNDMLADHFFTKASRIIPAILFLVLIQFTLTSRASLAGWLTRLTWIYIVIVVAVALSSVANVIWNHVDRKENTRKLPLKGIVQLVKGVVWIIAVIVVVAILLNRSPGSLFAGLGAFAAVLMLVFRDSILGVVAGVQLSENDSLHVGYWIKVGNANGIVREVSLTSVKVENFDKTVTTLPPYSLVSGGFTNMRNMQQSLTRRVERSYMIDADSIVAVDDAMLDRYSRIPLLSAWIAAKRRQKANGKVEDVFNSEGLVDGSIETNLGVFRAYVKLYLDAHPHVAHGGDGNDCFVSTLAQTSCGVPFQLYFFTNTSKWIPYESIMCQIMEHVAVSLYKFDLCTFEYPSGRDSLGEGYLSPGKNPADLFAAPQHLVRVQPEGAWAASANPEKKSADDGANRIEDTKGPVLGLVKE